MKRAIIIVLDAVGIGELPDADKYGDKGSNTLMHVKEALPALNLKNMCNLGLGLIDGDNVYEKVNNPKGIYGKMAEHSAGKDTTTGHWEISGIWIDKPFPTYPKGFPKEIIEEFESKIGRKVLGNCVASGTVIIQELGDEHMKTGYPIVYTSADSVFQIACHEDIIPIEEQYRYCEIAREILQGDNGVGRVIARPFISSNGHYTRTERRKDFSLPPIAPTLLDYVSDAGLTVSAVGKIEDIFCNRGITQSVHTHTNAEGIKQTIKYIENAPDGLIFTNLVEFDSKWGHRRNVEGYGQGLIDFDSRLPQIIDNLRNNDLLIINADHGCDPTFKGTDHTREYIPVIAYSKNCKNGVDLGILNSFSDIGATIAEIFGVKISNGESFLNKIL